MYNELFFRDGQTGQIIVLVLRPGNSHSNKWYAAILKRILKKIRASYPGMKIIIRADSGFSCPAFYQLADDFNLRFAIGLATNEALKKKTARAEKAVRHLFVSNNIKEVKNMCFSDWLSNYAFWANFLRLFISCLAYEMFLLLKEAIKKTGFELAKKWQIDTIRVALLKIGATIKITKRRVYYRFSKAFAHQELLRQLILQNKEIKIITMGLLCLAVRK